MLLRVLARFGFTGPLDRYQKRIRAAFAEYRKAEAEGFAQMLQGGNLEPLLAEIRADTTNRIDLATRRLGL